MAHFAKIENDIVVQVIVIDNKHEKNGQEFINSLGLDGEWIQTSYNNNIRGKFAGLGDTYDRVNDLFVSPPPIIEELILESVIVEESAAAETPVE